MNDPVLRVLAARQVLADEGYSKSLLLSSAAHATSFFAVLIVTLLTPKAPIIRVIDGFAVPLPKGGGIPKAAAPVEKPAEAPPAPEAPKAEVKPPAPAALIKPVAPTIKKGVAPVDLKRSVKEPKERPSQERATEKLTKPAPSAAAAATAPGTASAATGLDFTAQRHKRHDRPHRRARFLSGRCPEQDLGHLGAPDPSRLLGKCEGRVHDQSRRLGRRRGGDRVLGLVIP